jgi:hypothetical protein
MTHSDRTDRHNDDMLDLEGAETTAAEFAAAVKAALRDINRLDRLAGSRLVASRLVASRLVASRLVSSRLATVGDTSGDTSGDTVGSGGRARVLQQAIRAAAGQLAESPRQLAAYRALHHTYLQPAGSQRIACDLLHLPTTTYRRHLAAGVDQLTVILWQQECDGR